MANKTNKRKRSERMGNRFAMITITLVVISLALVLNAKVNSLKEKNNINMQRSQRLQAQIEAEEQRAQELEKYRIYVQTKQYIEEMAKEKLGLVNPDEIVIKPKED